MNRLPVPMAALAGAAADAARAQANFPRRPLKIIVPQQSGLRYLERWTKLVRAAGLKAD